MARVDNPSKRYASTILPPRSLLADTRWCPWRNASSEIFYPERRSCKENDTTELCLTVTNKPDTGLNCLEKSEPTYARLYSCPGVTTKRKLFQARRRQLAHCPVAQRVQRSCERRCREWNGRSDMFQVSLTLSSKAGCGHRKRSAFSEKCRPTTSLNDL